MLLENCTKLRHAFKKVVGMLSEKVHKIAGMLLENGTKLRHAFRKRYKIAGMFLLWHKNDTFLENGTKMTHAFRKLHKIAARF